MEKVQLALQFRRIDIRKPVYLYKIQLLFTDIVWITTELCIINAVLRISLALRETTGRTAARHRAGCQKIEGNENTPRTQHTHTRLKQHGHWAQQNRME